MAIIPLGRGEKVDAVTKAEIEALNGFCYCIRRLGPINTPEKSKLYRQAHLAFIKELDAIHKTKNSETFKGIYKSLSLEV